MTGWTAGDFIDEIDQTFLFAKKNRLSRFSLEWGKWSRELNLVLREKIKKEHERIQASSKKDKRWPFLLAFTYWTLKSEILEMMFRNRIMNLGKIQKKEKEAKRIQKWIREEQSYV